MAPKKPADTNAAPTEKSLIWSSKMDDALIDAFLHKMDVGNKVNGTFTTNAYDNIVTYLTALLGFKVEKDKVKNRWKTLKKNYSEIYDIFKGSMSGFSWNSSTHTWEAEDQVWDQLIQVKPKAAVWRNISLPNYQKMLALYGNDRATRDDGETPSSIRKRHRSSLPPARSTTPAAYSSPPPAENEVDQLLSRNNVCFQDFSVNLDNVDYEELSPEAQSETSKRTRRGAANNERVNSDGALIAKQIQEIASAIREGNQVFRERYASQISGEDTFKLIRESGCDEDKVSDIYYFLIHDVSKLRIVIECPPPMRKQVIMKLVFGG